MNCIVIDDEKHCLGSMQILIERNLPELQILTLCSSGQEGLEAIRKYKPDLVFLDISMPKMNGFEMLDQIEQPEFELIFTTAYDQYAFDAFKVSAMDYLMKPIDEDELVDAVLRVEKRMKKVAGQLDATLIKQQLNTLALNMDQARNQLPTIPIPTLEGIEMLPTASVYFIESDGNYCKCFKKDGDYTMITRTLGILESQLATYNFVRVHRSYMINLMHLQKYIRGEGGHVILSNGKSIPVSRRRKEELVKKLNLNSA